MEDLHDLEIERIEVIGFQKKGHDNVFIVNVAYSNDWEIEVFRRYSDIVALQRTLLKFTQHNISHFPQLPAFTELFENVFSDEEGSYCQPSLDLLDNYFSSLCNIDCQLVNQFFESDDYDMKLNEKDIRNKMDCDEIMQTSLPQYLVLMDFNCKQGSFAVRAGDTVTQIGIDKQDFSLIGIKHGGKMQFGWIPSVYLLNIEGKDDPLVKDLVTYFTEIQANDERTDQDSVPFVRPISVNSNSSSIYSTSSRGSVCEDSHTLGYYQYCLTDDCYLSCSFGEDVLMSVGEKVVVIDKDTDGWWYVTAVNGIEGWLPSTILEPRRVSLKKGNRELDKVYQPADVFTERHSPCYVSKPYKAKHKDELTVKAGEMVKLMYESPSGWWTVQHNRSVGLLPALFLTRQTSTKMSQPLKKAFTVGFNCSLLTEPPPRRDTFSRCTSPISPPPIMDFDISMYTSRIKQDGHRAWTPSSYLSTNESRCSDFSSLSPQPIESPPVDICTDDVFRDDDHMPSSLSTRLSNRAFSSPLTSVNVNSRSSTSPSLFDGRSPIPNRFLGKDYSILPRGSMSPMGDRSRSPIPDRFMSNRSLTPELMMGRSSLPIIPHSSISPLVEGRNSPDTIYGIRKQRLVKVASIDINEDNPLTDENDVINDDVINSNVIVNRGARHSLVRSPHVQSCMELDPDSTPKLSSRVPVYLSISNNELFVDDDEAIRRNMTRTNSVDHTQSFTGRQTPPTSSLHSILRSRAASAPPTTKLKQDKIKIDLRRKRFSTKHELFIPNMETGL